MVIVISVKIAYAYLETFDKEIDEVKRWSKSQFMSSHCKASTD
jgi:hypothetical protein